MGMFHALVGACCLDADARSSSAGVLPRVSDSSLRKRGEGVVVLFSQRLTLTALVPRRSARSSCDQPRSLRAWLRPRRGRLSWLFTITSCLLAFCYVLRKGGKYV